MKSKKFKLTLAAIMTALSAAALATGTFAWFTAASVVKVSGMEMTAETENGIVISNEAKSEWKTEAVASHSGDDAGFVPTSTSDTVTWYHGLSGDAADGQAYEEISTITVVDNIPAADPAPAYGTANDGIFGFMDTPNWKNVYLLNSFYIQSSSVDAINAQDIYVRDFDVKISDSDPAADPAQELSKSLRVAVVKHGESTPVIVAPVSGADASNDIGLVGSKTTITAATVTNVDTLEIDSNVTIPSYTADGANALRYDVFIYFEGEDASCKSNNIPQTVEELSVGFKFGNKAHD